MREKKPQSHGKLKRTSETTGSIALSIEIGYPGGMKKIVSAEVLGEYTVRLKFSDNTEGTADLSGLVGKGVFALWEDYETFRQVKIGDAGELAWGDQIDLCPDALYLEVTGRQPDELFSGLKSDAACA